MAAPRPTTVARRDDLEELLQLIRRDLKGREEAPAGDWVEATAAELKSGARPGWYVPTAEGGALAFYARRGSAAYGHVHAVAGPEADARAVEVATTLLEALPSEVASIVLGFTGLAPDAEGRVVAQLARRPGSAVIARRALERPISPADGTDLGGAPPGTRAVAVADVTLEALADLDLRAFAGSVDALLVGPEVADYRRVLDAILVGDLGRFVDEASVALIADAPTRLIGVLLTTEQTAHRATFVDLTVTPERRGAGVGRWLMSWGFRALRALGYERVRLWVTDANAPARALYDRLGFELVATATLYRWDRGPGDPHPQTSR